MHALPSLPATGRIPPFIPATDIYHGRFDPSGLINPRINPQIPRTDPIQTTAWVFARVSGEALDWAWGNSPMGGNA